MFLSKLEITRHFPSFIEGGDEDNIKEVSYDLRGGTRSIAPKNGYRTVFRRIVSPM
jgi:hypothetical protein